MLAREIDTTPHNGFGNWTTWNVVLWTLNDERGNWIHSLCADPRVTPEHLKASVTQLMFVIGDRDDAGRITTKDGAVVGSPLIDWDEVLEAIRG